MSDETPYPLWATYRVSKLDYMGTGVSLPYYYLPPQLDRDGWAQAAKWRRTVGRLVDGAPESFDVVRRTESYDKYSADLVVIGEPVTSMRPVADELRADAAQHGVVRVGSDFEMLATVLMLGVVQGQYGSIYSGDERDQLHLMGCGIEWASWTGVHMDRWSVWNGTFAEDTDEDKLATTLECRCDEGVWLTYGLEPPSLEQLFVNMSLDTIDKIYKV